MPRLERSPLPPPERIELASGYREAALALARETSHEGQLGIEPAALTLTSKYEELCLIARVTPVDHRIVAAAHEGAASEPVRGVLECACRVITGLPILEATEHGALRVGLALRQRDAPPPRAGVVLPEHAGLALSTLSELLAQLLQAYRDETGYADRDSDYWPAPSAAWAALDDRARLEAVNAVLALLWPSRELCATSVGQVTRISLSVAPELTIHERRRALLVAESELRRRLEPTLVVECETLRDLSPLRRL
jgi:hypothetical protein